MDFRAGRHLWMVAGIPVTEEVHKAGTSRLPPGQPEDRREISYDPILTAGDLPVLSSCLAPARCSV